MLPRLLRRAWPCGLNSATSAFAAGVGSLRHVSVQGIDLKPGFVLEVDGGALKSVVKAVHTQGRAGMRGHVQVEYRDLRTGLKSVARLRPDEAVERVQLEMRPFTLLYADGDVAHAMCNSTHEQLELPRALFADQGFDFIDDGMAVDVSYHDGAPVAAALPQHWTYEVAEADPWAKGQNATAVYKSALLANGKRVTVPPFVNPGERVVLEVATGDFVRRAKDA